MADYDNIVRERQKHIRRQIENQDISIKAIWVDGGWNESSTVLSYFPADENKQPAVMSVANLYRFLKTKALPPELLSALLPDEYAIVRRPGPVDHDAIASWCIEFLAKWNAAKHPESEAGTNTGPKENEDLIATVVQLQVAA